MASEIIQINSGNIAQILASTNLGAIVGRPFEEHIYLVDVHIAGTTHALNIEELVSGLKVGDRLRFERDPDNLYDPLAIRVLNDAAAQLGYIPCDNNEILARLMDGGKLLYGEITKMELLGEWHKLTMHVFLDD